MAVSGKGVLQLEPESVDWMEIRVPLRMGVTPVRTQNLIAGCVGTAIGALLLSMSLVPQIGFTHPGAAAGLSCAILAIGLVMLSVGLRTPSAVGFSTGGLYVRYGKHESAFPRADIASIAVAATRFSAEGAVEVRLRDGRSHQLRYLHPPIAKRMLAFLAEEPEGSAASSGNQPNLDVDTEGRAPDSPWAVTVLPDGRRLIDTTRPDRAFSRRATQQAGWYTASVSSVRRGARLLVVWVSAMMAILGFVITWDVTRDPALAAIVAIFVALMAAPVALMLVRNDLGGLSGKSGLQLGPGTDPPGRVKRLVGAAASQLGMAVLKEWKSGEVRQWRLSKGLEVLYAPGSELSEAHVSVRSRGHDQVERHQILKGLILAGMGGDKGPPTAVARVAAPASRLPPIQLRRGPQPEGAPNPPPWARTVTVGGRMPARDLYARSEELEEGPVGWWVSAWRDPNDEMELRWGKPMGLAGAALTVIAVVVAFALPPARSAAIFASIFASSLAVTGPLIYYMQRHGVRAFNDANAHSSLRIEVQGAPIEAVAAAIDSALEGTGAQRAAGEIAGGPFARWSEPGKRLTMSLRRGRRAGEVVLDLVSTLPAERIVAIKGRIAEALYGDP